MIMDICETLPEGCIANVISFTSPKDACNLSLVASTFRSAAESDAVWENFLPSDYQDLIARAVDPSPSVFGFGSKKELYLSLCNSPIVIDGGTKSFWLEKWTGKKCYMLAARDLAIVWGDTPRYWKWTSLPDSRFGEVAELIDVCWLEIRGKINTCMLSPNTTYSAYMVYKCSPEAYGFDYQPAEGCVGISGNEGEKHSVYLDPEAGRRRQCQHIPRRIGFFNRRFSNASREQESTERDGGEGGGEQYPKERSDGWLEMKLGEYVHHGGGDGELEMSLLEVKGGQWKSGLIIQGIEIRPKEIKK